MRMQQDASHPRDIPSDPEQAYQRGRDDLYNEIMEGISTVERVPFAHDPDGNPLHPGDRVFNYYDRKAGRIKPHSIEHDGWFDLVQDDSTVAYLNAERVCSIQTARAKGWLE